MKLPSQFSQYLPAPYIPADNPLTVGGVALGRKFFYDPILSGDETQSCASCHNPSLAFTDNGLQFSTGIDNIQGNRNAMVIFNMIWNFDDTYFGIEEQMEWKHKPLGP